MYLIYEHYHIILYEVLLYAKLRVRIIYIYRLINECDLQLYEGVALSFNSQSQTEEQSFEY